MMLRAPLAALMVLTLSGCALIGDQADKALRKTPSWRDGYQDGCAAANDSYTDFRKGPNTDNPLYRTDATYRSGWGNGYQSCRSINTPGTQANAPSSWPLPEPSPGHQ